MRPSWDRTIGNGVRLGRVTPGARDLGLALIEDPIDVESNRVAVRLWQSFGFQILTTVPEAFDHRTAGLVGLHVMYLPLSDSASRGP